MVRCGKHFRPFRLSPGAAKPIPGITGDQQEPWNSAETASKTHDLQTAATNWFFLKPFAAPARAGFGRTPTLLHFRLVLPNPSRLQKKLHGYCRLSSDVPVYDLRMIPHVGDLSGSENRLSRARTSLLASIHKKTLAGFSDSSGDSIAAAALSPTRRLRGSRAQASNWLRALFLFSLFYARNISVAPL